MKKIIFCLIISTIVAACDGVPPIFKDVFRDDFSRYLPPETCAPYDTESVFTAKNTNSKNLSKQCVHQFHSCCTLLSQSLIQEYASSGSKQFPNVNTKSEEIVDYCLNHFELQEKGKHLRKDAVKNTKEMIIAYKKQYLE